MAKRPEAPDTIDTATHLLHRLQLDGWGVCSVICEIEYGAPTSKSRLLPVEATVTVRLASGRGER